jgi:hypothetical protein
MLAMRRGSQLVLPEFRLLLAGPLSLLQNAGHSSRRTAVEAFGCSARPFGDAEFEDQR